MNFIIKSISNIVSGLVVIRYIRLPTRYLSKVISKRGDLLSFFNLQSINIGDQTSFQSCMMNLTKRSSTYLSLNDKYNLQWFLDLNTK